MTATPTNTAAELGLTDRELLEGLEKDLRERGTFNGRVLDAALIYQADAVRRLLDGQRAADLLSMAAHSVLASEVQPPAYPLKPQVGFEQLRALREALKPFGPVAVPMQRAEKDKPHEYVGAIVFQHGPATCIFGVLQDGGPCLKPENDPIHTPAAPATSPKVGTSYQARLEELKAQTQILTRLAAGEADGDESPEDEADPYSPHIFVGGWCDNPEICEVCLEQANHHIHTPAAPAESKG